MGEYNGCNSGIVLRRYVEEANLNDCPTVQTKEQWVRDWCIKRIKTDTHKENLRIYCEWNGLIGYASTLYDIAHGDIYLK